jgi:hypothetical protein
VHRSLRTTMLGPKLGTLYCIVIEIETETSDMKRSPTVDHLKSKSRRAYHTWLGVGWQESRLRRCGRCVVDESPVGRLLVLVEWSNARCDHSAGPPCPSKPLECPIGRVILHLDEVACTMSFVRFIPLSLEIESYAGIECQLDAV